MSAIIAVLNTPWYAVTHGDGQVHHRRGARRGSTSCDIFHERALPENLRFLEHRITVPESGLALPLISISETGFIPAPHLNKYGKDYPPVGQ